MNRWHDRHIEHEMRKVLICVHNYEFIFNLISMAIHFMQKLRKTWVVSYSESCVWQVCERGVEGVVVFVQGRGSEGEGKVISLVWSTCGDD